MKLIFVRHGQAGPYCADDAGRDLTDFGRQQANQTAKFLVDNLTNGIKLNSVDCIISSPFNRANQTAQIIAHALGEQGVSPDFISLDTITPDDDPVRGLDDIERLVYDKFGVDTDHRTIVVVCHMPIVGYMTAILDGLSPSSFELAECRVLQTSVIAPQLAQELTRFVPTQP